MPRVHHVKKAQKDNPVCKKGESYYWWKFRYGGKRYSLTYPKASQLTQSAYLSTVYSIGENFDDVSGMSKSDALDALDEARSEVEALRDETQDSLSRSEDAFPNGSPTIDLLQERVDALETLEQEISDAHTEIDNLPDDDESEEGDEKEKDETDDSHSMTPEEVSEKIAEEIGNIDFGAAAV